MGQQSQVKPICLMHINDRMFRDSPNINLVDIQEIYDKSLEGYNVIVVPIYYSRGHRDEGRTIRIEVFHPKNITDIEWKELNNFVKTKFEQYEHDKATEAERELREQHY